MSNRNDTASAAQDYIERGWAVIQLHDVARAVCSCGSADEPNHSKSQGGKHPIGGGWQNAGMRDPELAGRAWAGRPDANIGIVTGRASGIWVLDVDPEHGGDEKLAELCAANGSLPRTYVVQTGSGGRHYYFLMPDFDFTTSRGLLPVGLDVRGNRGQVVAPPSFTLKGTYRVIVDVPIAPAPAWLLAMIRPPERIEVEAGEWAGSGMAAVTNADRGSGYARAAIERLLYEMSAAPPGTRNDTAYRVGRRLAELVASGWSGLDGAAVFASFMNAALVADVDGGFSQTEAEQTLRKAIKDQAGRGVALPEADFYGTVWTPPAPVFPPGTFDVTGSEVAGGGGQTDFDQAGQGPANPFTSPGGMGPSTEVAAPMINGPTEQGEVVDPWELAVARELSRLLVREEAEKRKIARTERVTDFDALALDIAALRKLPAPEPLVDGYLFQDTLARINGPSGHGKSFVAVDLMCCVGAGRTWHGHAVTRMSGLYVVAEGVAGMRYRAEAWQERHQVEDDELGVTFIAQAVQIGGADWERFVDWCARRAFGYIVLDTQARNTVGRKENDATEMGEVVAGMDVLRAATRACVQLVHHRGKTGDEGRGSTAMKGAMDTEMDVSRVGVTLTVKVTKQKDHAEPAPMLLTMNSLADSMVLIGDMEAPTGSPFTSPREQLSGQEKAGLAIAQALLDAVGSGLTRAEAQSHARIAMNLPATETVKKMIRRAWADLVGLGRIAKAAGREAYFWIEVEGLGRLDANPGKLVEGGPELYVPV